MAKFYQDFVGLNTFIYEPSGYDEELQRVEVSSQYTGSFEKGYGVRHNGQEAREYLYVPLNHIGPVELGPFDLKIYQIKNDFPFDLPTTASFFNALMSKRGNIYGYPTWRQLRVSNNQVTRRQKKHSIFTYVQEPGPIIANGRAKYGNIVSMREPVVSQNHPVSLIGEVSVYNEELGIFEKKPVEIKTSFGNEITFFANQEANEYFNTILETDENYETLKEMYLDGGLDNEGSLLDTFSLLTYRQSIWPKQRYAYLDQTRARKFYVNTFWRSDRQNRTRLNNEDVFGATIASQSMWPLDAREDFKTRTEPTRNIGDGNLSDDYIEFDIGGLYDDNATSAPGILQNRYSTFALGGYYDASSSANREPRLLLKVYRDEPSIDLSQNLTASLEYSRLHTLKNLYSSVNPSGPFLVYGEMVADQDTGSPLWPSNTTSSIFNGRANWDVPSQSNKEPFYDSYEDYSQGLRNKGKGFSVIPEFRISSHVSAYQSEGVTHELKPIFEISGVMSQNTTTEDEPAFYKIISNSDFLAHFDLVKKDHENFANEKILTLKCKGIKKFLPYEGFYPAQRSVELSKQFSSSYGRNIDVTLNSPDVEIENYDQFSIKPLLTPMFAPGILFNTIKSGVAVDFPLIFQEDIVRDDPYGFNTFSYVDDIERRVYGNTADGNYSPEDLNNAVLGQTARVQLDNYVSTFSKRIPFEALVEPESYLANESLVLQEPHPYALSEFEIESVWDGGGDPLYKKMMNNFLSEIPDFFIESRNLKTIASMEEQNPEFGNAVSGNYYIMRVKMSKTRSSKNISLGGYDGFPVTPPQDVVSQGVDATGSNDGFQLARNRTIRENITMYSRPSAFGPPSSGDGGTISKNGINFWMGSTWGYNFPYTPPYYHGDSWCDLIFYATETKKYTLDEIMSQAKEYPYYTRYWNPSFHDALRDLTGYSGSLVNAESDYYKYSSSPWAALITGSTGIYSNISSQFSDTTSSPNYEWEDWGDMYGTNEIKWRAPDRFDSTGGSEDLSFWRLNGPQSPIRLNSNAMQLDSSVNIFGKGIVKKIYDDSSETTTEVASSDTVRGKTRWIIQPKFETPILNFNKYNDLSDPDLKCSEPLFAKSQVPRGMWHQYGDIPGENEGIFLQVEDIPDFWLRGALGVSRNSKKIKSLADLVGFSKDPVRLGEVASKKEISECVVAAPFIEKDGTRKFFSIPRADIASCINASKREIDGNFPAGGPPKAGDTVYQMVKKMQKYVFPPSMDFVKYEEIDPFAMYIFEFKHTLSKQDLADIWQNLPPEIGTQMEEAEASISHELLAHELLGGGAVVKNGELDENAEGKGIPSNIQWMIFKVKKRAKTSYFDKIVAKKGTTEDTSGIQLEGVTSMVSGKKDKEITYNWPYDFFSLVELVKIDAEVSFANIENDDKGQKSIKKVESTKTRNPSMINKARGKGRTE
jgi:hypothetical protein